MADRTQAMRTLEGKRIPYEVLTYPDDMRDAVEIALLLGVPPAEVFKTLVVLPPEMGKKLLLVMIPAPAQLDLKKLAEVVGTKKLKMATHISSAKNGTAKHMIILVAVAVKFPL